jgi:hypothetical protein
MLVGLMVCGLILTGCQVNTNSQDVSHFSTNRAATIGKAAYAGTYTLFTDEYAAKGDTVLLSVHLVPGETIGFEIDPTQKPFAVAGANRMPLTAGRYRWEMKPDPGQVDWNQTNVMIVEVVVATAVVTLAVVGTLIAVKAI